MLERNQSYSESCQKKPPFDNSVSEEAYLMGKIRNKYPEMQDMIKFCRECRKFIRRAQQRALINEIDGSCITHIRRNLWVAEMILFEELFPANKCPVTEFREIPELVHEMDGWGYNILAFGRIILHRKYKTQPGNPLSYMNRMDRIRQEINRMKVELSDGYY